MADRAIPFKIKPFVQGQNIADASDVEIDASGFDGNLQNTDTDVQEIAQRFDDYPGITDATLEDSIAGLPTASPNYYYERLTPGSGMGTIATSYVIPATGDAPVFAFIPQKNSVGGILADIPFENVFQGQIQLQSDVDCLLEIDARFVHYTGLPGEFTESRSVFISLDAGEPVTHDMNSFSSEVIVSLTDTITQEILDAPFPYNYDLVFTAFNRTDGTTRIAANISGIQLLKPALIFKQANRIVGPRGAQGPPGVSSQFAALADRDVLYTLDPQPFAATSTSPLSFTINLPSDKDSLNDYAVLIIGISNSPNTPIAYTQVDASLVEAATNSNRFTWLNNISGALSQNAFELYQITPTSYGFAGGNNRPYLRRVIGVNYSGESAGFNDIFYVNQRVPVGSFSSVSELTYPFSVFPITDVKAIVSLSAASAARSLFVRLVNSANPSIIYFTGQFSVTTTESETFTLSRTATALPTVDTEVIFTVATLSGTNIVINGFIISEQ